MEPKRKRKNIASERNTNYSLISSSTGTTEANKETQTHKPPTGTLPTETSLLPQTTT
jgi:hypothetical protein